MAGAGTWLVETALAMAEAFLGTPGRYTGPLRASFACRISAGPVDAPTQQQIIAQQAAGLLSRESAMEALGVEDTDAELARIASDPSSMLTLRQRQAAVFDAWQAAGLGLQAAARLAGLSDAEIAMLESAQTDVTPPARVPTRTSSAAA